MNIRFGDERYRQSRLQARRNAEPGSGRRRADPHIHATSRPYHTSQTGIRMNVTQNAQIAEAMKDPVQQKYLNAMKLSEKAQQKVGRAEEDSGRQYDKMGVAMLQGLQHSQGRGKMVGPNQNAIDRLQASIMGRVAQFEREFPAESQAERDDKNEGNARYKRLRDAISTMKRAGAGAGLYAFNHHFYRR